LSFLGLLRFVYNTIRIILGNIQKSGSIEGIFSLSA
jgi:hypothetical protein